MDIKWIQREKKRKGGDQLDENGRDHPGEAAEDAGNAGHEVVVNDQDVTVIQAQL